jgi:hypothetical protein
MDTTPRRTSSPAGQHFSSASLDFTRTDAAAVPQVLLDNVYEALVKLNNDGPVVPDLTTSWTWPARAPRAVWQPPQAPLQQALSKESNVDILPAMNDQDSNRYPEGNMLRFALHRQGQNSQVSTRRHGEPCRGTAQTVAGHGYRLPELNLPDPGDKAKGFLPALNDRGSTPERR